MIKVDSLEKSYAGKKVVEIPALEIKTGEMIGLVGNNGAGKTTFFRLLLDLIRADKGNIQSNDNDVSKSELWKRYTAAYLDEGFLIDYLTPEEYFYFTGKLNNKSKADVDDFLKSFDTFFDGSVLKSGKYIRELSKGNQFKVGIAACLLQRPELLILDEPFANLDPSSQMRLLKLLREMQSQHRMTILISSHDLNHVTDISTRILLMEKGRIIRDLHTTEDTLKELEEYFKI
ncbi:MAG: ABC transporter ATP-binding protein [Chitinophagaceae bacterium]|nr:ABC transporter ATP-binding protein [Chitinophagaceae bacterium]